MLYVVKYVKLKNKDIKMYQVIIDDTCYIFINNSKKSLKPTRVT